jgi:hypothetical protein
MLANRKRVNVYTLSASGSGSIKATKLTMYLAPTGTAGQQPLRGVIYADAGGTPGALVASSNEFVFSSSDAAGWYDLTLPSPVTLAPGTYWIGVLSGSSSYVTGFRYDQVSGSRVVNGNTYTSGPSDPFGAIGGGDAKEMSVYVTYTVG